MLKPIVRQGLIVPACVAVLAALVFFVAGGAAACIVLAIGAAAIILFHLIHLQRIADWAAGPLDAASSGGPRRVGHAVRRDLSPHANAECVRARPCVTSSSGSAGGRGAARRHGRARRGNRIDWANPRAQRAARPRPRARRRPADRRISCGSRSSSATSKPAISRRRSSCRRVATRAGATLAIQLVPFGVDQKLLLSRDVTRARSRRADAPRLHRQRLARAQDAAHRHQRIRRDAAGHRRSTSGSASDTCN